jgi:hypothetical protein
VIRFGGVQPKGRRARRSSARLFEV